MSETADAHRRLLLLIIVCFIPGAYLQFSGLPCDAQQHGNSVVCVCSSSYCDTLELPEELEPNRFYIYTSTKSGLRFHLNIEDPDDAEPVTPDNTVKISTSNVSQEILGFGGSLTDAAGVNIASLSTFTQEHLLDSYFSKNGLEFTFVRVPIGGTDFSERAYTLADVENQDFPVTLDSVMNLAPEDYSYKIPIIERILDKNPGKIKLLSSAWTAPDWMMYEDFSFQKTINPAHYADWAEYHKRFFDFYKEYNITFWGSTTGNEPEGGLLSIPWSRKEHQIWINNHLGPLLDNSGYGDMKLLMMDDSTPYLLSWQNLLNNPVTNNYIDGVATHWYLDHWIYVIHGLFHFKYPDKIILSTEASICKYEEHYKDFDDWYKAEKYAENIIQKMNNYCAGWIDWNLALNLNGGPNILENYCDAAILINSVHDEFYKFSIFYAMGHFSKFVPPGSHKINHVVPYNPHISFAAFKVVDSPWNLATVILNTNEKEEVIRFCFDDGFCKTIKMQPKSISTVIARRII